MNNKRPVKIPDNPQEAYQVGYKDAKDEIIKADHGDQMTLLKVKSLLSNLSYVIKKEHLPVVSKYHELCRKYCSWKNALGEEDEEE